MRSIGWGHDQGSLFQGAGEVARHIGAALFILASGGTAALPTPASASASHEEDATRAQVTDRAVRELQQIRRLRYSSDVERAIRRADAALDRDWPPLDRAALFIERASLYERLARFRAAAGDLEAAIALNALPPALQARQYIEVADMLAADQDFAGAASAYEAGFSAGARATPDDVSLIGLVYVSAADGAESEREQAALLAIAGPAKAQQRESVSAIQAGVMNALSQGSPIAAEDWRDQVTRALRRGEREEALAHYHLWRASGAVMRAGDIAAYADLLAETGLPLEAARLLLAEFEAGRFGADPEPLRRAGQYAISAHEEILALEILQRVADLTDAGEDWFILGECAHRMGRITQSQTALETALVKRGYGYAGHAWLMIGEARFGVALSAGEGRRRYEGALAAFERAACFPAVREAAAGWFSFVRRRSDQRPLYGNQIMVDECRLTLEAERRMLILTEGLDAEAMIAIPEDAFPERCAPYFNAYGEQIAEPVAAPSESQPQPQRIEPPGLDTSFCEDIRAGLIPE